jgi:hypothetical protein
LCKAYKAVALLLVDNGKDDEAAALVDQVRKTSPVDPRLIAILVQAMDILGKGLSQGASVVLIERRGSSDTLRGSFKEASQG